MKALITGASSGIGRDFAHVLGSMGCELILVARRENRMEELRNELPVPVQIICADLSSERECFALYEQVREEHIDILIKCRVWRIRCIPRNRSDGGIKAY